ncbi:phage major capsid protein [Methylovirgula sp. HY1]|uniref:phage major capsid protein n=1 Tax=Methylovirgula sp. HY1 TaxID=2822761 RepID=UPI001C5B7BB0|nr:phage major capsid protein [Methylovirgula sp. HY1]QXX74247.1 hypothetical protein MHY1_01057 [Methylovirgula sp. HY1]
MALKQLREAYQRAVDELNNEDIIADARKYEAKEAEIVKLEGDITRAEKAQERAARAAQPLGSGNEAYDRAALSGGIEDVADNVVDLAMARGLLRASSPLDAYSTQGREAGRRFERALSRARREIGMTVIDREKHFRSFGEQLVAIYNQAMSRNQNVDPRLVFERDAFNRAPTGASEVDPTGGGFLVQSDFAAAIFMIAHDMGDVISRVNKVPISDKSNSMKIPGVDETSRQTGSRWGGVQSYWLGEGTAPTATKPKMRMLDWNLHKLFSVMYTTDELLQDQTALTAIASQAFSEEIMFMTEDAIFEGLGAGQPLGVMNSAALITQATSTATATVLKTDIDNMWARCWARSRKNAVWFINQDVEPALLNLNQPVGSSGGVGGTLVYMPPGGMSELPFGKLYSRPVLPIEYANTLGTAGDITLLDLSQYTLIDKGGVQAATSMHVAFLTDQMVFRITYRVDGKPMWTLPITPFKGANTHSPFVALATR